MKVVGFTFIRNGVKYDYPFIESLNSLLPICDEVIVNVGDSEDSTLDHILALNIPKIKIIESKWDESLRTGGLILAQQTNIALDQVNGDWAFYLQADEVLHEQDYNSIKESMELYKTNPKVEGLLFNYNHFFGSYNYIGNSRRWYRREIRIVRPNIGVRSWRDAQGFRIDNSKLKVKLVDASIYHYGWVKPPEIQQFKQKNFNKLWHSDEWIKQNIDKSSKYNYAQCGRLSPFSGSHPSVMKIRIHQQDWTFSYDESINKPALKDRILDAVADKSGWRIGEYRNYKLI